jgi:hypothetical protein
MSQIVLLPKTKSDLGGIWDDTLEEWGVEQAESMSLSFDRKYKSKPTTIQHLPISVVSDLDTGKGRLDLL